MKIDRLTLVGITVLILLLFLAVVELARTRLESGDLHPPYSTLRADPQGAAAFRETLERWPGLRSEIQIEELEKTAEQLPIGTLFLLGLQASWLNSQFSTELARSLERYASRGGRVVLALEPKTGSESELQIDARERAVRRELEERDELPPEEKKNKDKTSTKPESETKEKLDPESLWDWRVYPWEMSFRARELPDAGEEEPAFVSLSGDTFDEPVRWYSAWVLTKFDDTKWKVLLHRDDQAVALEQKIGRGSIVLVTDSFQTSNEGIWRDRQAEYLLWLGGDVLKNGGVVIFDESHLGVLADPGLAMLLRKFRLEGFIIGLLLFGIFLVWKTLCPLVPPFDSKEDGLVEFPPDDASGLQNLIRRAVPSGDLIPLCVRRWMEAVRPRAELEREVLALVDAESALPISKQNPVRIYQAIQSIVQKRKTL